MTEISSSPSPWLRLGAAAARFALWLLVSAWLVLAMVWGALHFVIVPRIAEFRPYLEEQASKVLGITVQIASIEAQSNGLIPSIALHDVRFLDAQGREGLHLPKVIAALSPRSVLALGFEQLYVDSPVLEMRRTPDGRIWLAGFALPSSPSQGGAGADWVFSQAELVIRNGTLQWTDEMRNAPPLALTQVDWVVRNRHFSHSIRLDATPPATWGSRFSAIGVFKQPLLVRHAGAWQEWTGQLYANFDHVDVAQLRQYADVGADVERGTGAVRAWADVKRATVTSATADVALRDVSVRMEQGLEPLSFAWMAGRVGLRALDGGHEFTTQALEFDTQDGLHWPGGNVRVALYAAHGKNPARGDVVADRLDLAAMAQIATRLPFDPSVHEVLMGLAPRGTVERVEGNWQGVLHNPIRFAAKGRVSQLALAARVGKTGTTPGFQGADIDFDLNQSAGKASIAMRDGSFDAAGVFEEPLIALDQLAAEVQWKVEGQHISLNMPSVRFSNADAQGEVQIKWHTGEADALPGFMDMQGTLSRAQANRVHRYLPQVMNKEVRDYLRDAVLEGKASAVKFKVKGNLNDFPFERANQGEFRIAATMNDVTYAFAPSSILPKDSLPWPTLSRISGDFLMDRSVLQIKAARASLDAAGALQVRRSEAVVDNLYQAATVTVTADVQGPLADGLGVVNSSPLGSMMGKALARASASGTADYRFKLAFPIAAVDRATVAGSIALAGNELQVSPETPRLSRMRGTLVFSESGFSVTGLQARALGGDVRVDGGLGVSGKSAASVLRLQGTASAEGLRQARELGLVSRLAQYADGAAAYTATLGLRAGVLELLVNSNLMGMSLGLPAPFSKTTDSVLPLRLETSAQQLASSSGGIGRPEGRLVDVLRLDVGQLASVAYERDVTGAQAKVLRGAIGVGLAADEAAPMPDEGVIANVNLNQVDLDAWGSVLARAASNEPVVAAATVQDNALAMAYLPTSMAVRAKEITMGGRKLSKVVVGAGREGLLWRANVDSSELNGYIEYRQSSGASLGRLYGRLAHLVIAPSTAKDVESLLDEQPSSIPALDIVVEDFELRGKKLGRIEIDAVNLGGGLGGGRDAPREWRLNRFNITTPEAVLTATGNWTDINAQASTSVARVVNDRRRTALNFKLDIADAGDVLTRFGMPGVVRNGRGKVEGRVAWQGSPITLDYPTMSGTFNVNVENGQFLKTDPGIGKLLGVLSLQSLPRRLTLDFRDVFSEGFAFDFFRGDVAIEQGIARTNNLQMKGVTAAALMEGQADIAKETQSIKVVVVPEINAGSASLLATVINPVMGLTSFLAQWILRKPLIEATTFELRIDGTWLDPVVTRVEHTGNPSTPTNSETAP
jgi:uncharacterized protein (TIGR02099 family)